MEKQYCVVKRGNPGVQGTVFTCQLHDATSCGSFRALLNLSEPVSSPVNDDDHLAHHCES